MAWHQLHMVKIFHLQHSEKNVHEKKCVTVNPNEQQLTVREVPEYKWDIVWIHVIFLSYVHIAAIYGIYLSFTSTMFYTILWSFLMGIMSGLGITAGSHRLWSHRTYEAKWPLRLFLMVGQTLSFQRSIYHWTKEHRLHHKFTDTDADPYNIKRGFFFSHVGWILLRPHPDLIKKSSTIQLDDLQRDPIVVWQRKWYKIFVILCCFVLPTWIPVHFWGEDPWKAWYSNMFRLMLSLNITWLVNSAAHMWGMKPYDSAITPTDGRIVAFLSLGEGWHNYHHVFPWDYKTGEFGNHNFTATFIDLCGRLGLAYNMKTVPTDLVKKRAIKSGDGSKYHNMNCGFGDVDIAMGQIENAKITQDRTMNHNP
ncbi:acyl-CoA Delta12-desaturase-like [Nomia melanderi]|uniref:acyl-CoA Delta12-desaturase-like n=1 Tax=Nomia melanderi TaxID=2448451 RepID=UPI003FCDC17A